MSPLAILNEEAAKLFTLTGGKLLADVTRSQYNKNSHTLIIRAPALAYEFEVCTILYDPGRPFPCRVSRRSIHTDTANTEEFRATIRNTLQQQDVATVIQNLLGQLT